MRVIRSSCSRVVVHLGNVLRELIKSSHGLRRFGEGIQLNTPCLQKKGVPEGYVTIIQDMYNDCETLVSTRAGDTL